MILYYHIMLYYTMLYYTYYILYTYIHVCQCIYFVCFCLNHMLSEIVLTISCHITLYHTLSQYRVLYRTIIKMGYYGILCV